MYIKGLIDHLIWLTHNYSLAFTSQTQCSDNRKSHKQYGAGELTESNNFKFSWVELQTANSKNDDGDEEFSMEKQQ